MKFANPSERTEWATFACAALEPANLDEFESADGLAYDPAARIAQACETAALHADAMLEELRKRCAKRTDGEA